jgi:DNA-binding transcriptional MerR regulator
MESKDSAKKAYIEPHEADEYKKLLREKVFSLKDTGVSSRVFYLWKKLELVDTSFNKEGQGWANLCFSEYIWLKIIQDLRKFGCPLNEIKEAKNMLLGRGLSELEKDILKDGMNTMLKSFYDRIEKQGADIKKFKGAVLQVETAVRERKLYELMLDGLERPLNNLEIVIVDILAKKRDAYLMFTLPNTGLQGTVKAKGKKKLAVKSTDGNTSFPTLNIEFTIEQFPRVSPELPHLKISLWHYIKAFIADETKEKKLENIKILSPDEMELLKQIRQGNATEITVKMIDNKIDRIEVTTELKKDAESRIIETFTSSEYSDIAYKVANGKIVSFKKTTKIKSRKS